MKDRRSFQKIVLIALALLLVLSMMAPAILSQTVQSPRKEKLLNGLNVLMFQQPGEKTVKVAIRIHSGSAFDPQGKEGVMQLLADNLFPNEAAKEFFSEDLGGGLDIQVNYDHIQINASSTPDQMLSMLETLATALSNPTIDKETTAKIRTALLARLTPLESDPGYVAERKAAARLLGTFPYGRPQLGTAESVGRIDFADLIDARQRFLTADNTTLAISGNFDRSLALRAIKRFFGGWQKSDRRVPATFRQPDPPPMGVLTVPLNGKNVTAVQFTTRGVSRSDKDVAAASVLSAVVASRLRSAVPAGQITVTNSANLLPGTFSVKLTIPDAGPTPEVNSLLSKALLEPVTDAELQMAVAAARAEWNKRDIIDLWLDVDTYGVADPTSAAKMFDSLKLSDVNAFADRIRKQPSVAVVVRSQPAAQ